VDHHVSDMVDSEDLTFPPMGPPPGEVPWSFRLCCACASALLLTFSSAFTICMLEMQFQGVVMPVKQPTMLVLLPLPVFTSDAGP
jgi:hypothetical protein